MKLYLRYYAPQEPGQKKGYAEHILEAEDLIKKIKNQVKIDAVSLETGVVCRHDYKKPLPNWLSDPLLRQIAISNNAIP